MVAAGERGEGTFFPWRTAVGDVLMIQPIDENTIAEADKSCVCLVRGGGDCEKAGE
jgi:hypothetical protein